MEQRWNMQPQQVCIYVCMLLLSRYSHVGLCATPQMAAHQAPPSLGFSRQEHWSGLPFPSPVCVCVCVCVYSDMCVYVCRHIRVSQVVQLVKSMSANAGDQEMRVQSLGQENPPE